MTNGYNDLTLSITSKFNIYLLSTYIHILFSYFYHMTNKQQDISKEKKLF